MGIVLATIGAFVSALGLVLMRASAKYDKHLPWYKRPKLGISIFLMMFVNTALDTVAMAVAPLAVVAPIGGVTIVATMLYARLGVAVPRESVSLKQWTAVCIVVFGVALVDVYGPKSDPVLDSEKILSHLYEQSFLIYQSCACLASGGAILFLKFSAVDRGGARTAFVAAVGSGMCSGVTMVIMKVMSSCVGSFLINWSLPFSNPRFWVASVELAVYATVLVVLLQHCMACRDVALSSALYQSSLIICTIVAAESFYSELRKVELGRLLVFSCGVLCVVTGISCLVLLRKENSLDTGESNALNADKDIAEITFNDDNSDTEHGKRDERPSRKATIRVFPARDSALLRQCVEWIWRRRRRVTSAAPAVAVEPRADS